MEYRIWNILLVLILIVTQMGWVSPRNYIKVYLKYFSHDRRPIGLVYYSQINNELSPASSCDFAHLLLSIAL